MGERVGCEMEGWRFSAEAAHTTEKKKHTHRKLKHASKTWLLLFFLFLFFFSRRFCVLLAFAVFSFSRVCSSF